MQGQGGVARKGASWGRVAIGAAKLTVTGICFWYLARNMHVAEVTRSAHALDLRWAGLATLAMMLQILLVGLRWREVICVLDHGREQVARGPIVAILAICNFFAQVVPSIAADTARFLM